MPLSGSVTAGSAALASQYNNLRSDVLSTTQGHTHTGASENGAKVHGTALDTTGATNGQVLTANGSGGATFAAAAGAGQLSTLTGSAAFSTAASGVLTKYQISDTTSLPWTTLTGGGTVIIALCDTNADTGTHAIQSYYLGSTVIQGSSAVAQITAGTTQYNYPQGYGYASGTAFVIREAVKTTSPQQGYYLRKFNQTLGSNMWNATLINPAGNTLSTNYNSNGPFYQTTSSDSTKYEASIGVWIGADWRLGSMGTTDASLRVASVWVVNDASGSVYSATFGSAGVGTTGNHVARIRSVVYVPGVGTALGTVHAFGFVDNQPRWCQYAVGSASITAMSTADGISSMIAKTISADDIRYSFYASSATAVGIYDTNLDAYVFLDRTLGTVLARTANESSFVVPYGSNGNDGYFDLNTGWVAQNNSNVLNHRGTNANASHTTFGTTFAGSASYPMTAGAGSATTVVWASDGGVIASHPIAGIASVSIGSASTGRMITFTDPTAPVSISASSGYWIGNQMNSNAVTHTIDGLRRTPYIPTFVLPAGASAVVTYRSRAFNRDNATTTSLTTDRPSALSTAITVGSGTATWITAGGSALMTADVITLA